MAKRAEKLWRRQRYKSLAQRKHARRIRMLQKRLWSFIVRNRRRREEDSDSEGYDGDNEGGGWMEGEDSDNEGNEMQQPHNVPVVGGGNAGDNVVDEVNDTDEDDQMDVEDSSTDFSDAENEPAVTDQGQEMHVDVDNNNEANGNVGGAADNVAEYGAMANYGFPGLGYASPMGNYYNDNLGENLSPRFCVVEPNTVPYLTNTEVFYGTVNNGGTQDQARSGDNNGESSEVSERTSGSSLESNDQPSPSNNETQLSLPEYPVMQFCIVKPSVEGVENIYLCGIREGFW